MVDVLPVPKWFEDAIGKSKRKQVLDGLFAEIVVDTIDLRFIEVVMNLLIDQLRAGEIGAERFLDNYAYPLAFFRLRESCASELFDCRRIKTRRH